VGFTHDPPTSSGLPGWHFKGQIPEIWPFSKCFFSPILSYDIYVEWQRIKEKGSSLKGFPLLQCMKQALLDDVLHMSISTCAHKVVAVQNFANV